MDMGIGTVVPVVLVVYFIVAVVLRIGQKVSISICIIVGWAATALSVNGDTDLAEDVARAMFYMLVTAIALAVVENMRPPASEKQRKRDARKGSAHRKA